MSSTTLALLSLILGNLMASFSDVAVKLLEGEVFAFQYIFIRQFIATLVIAPLYFATRRNNHPVPPLNWKVTAIRANLIIVGASCMVVAITYLPLATANAVFYAAPLIMLPASLLLLKEKPNSYKVIATIVGFIGVLIVLRPSQFHWAAFFALGTAITIALFNVLVRKLPSEHSVIHTLFWTSLFSLPISGLLAMLNWTAMSDSQVIWTVTSSLCILAYNGLAVFAYKRAQADQIALSEYSGLIFVTLMGIAWFNELPDIFTLLGIGLIILPLVPPKYVFRRRRKANSM